MSTAPLPERTGTAVIGGGIVGLCLSWFLADAGERVLCLDDGRHAGSTANAGSLHVQMQSRFIRLYPDLAAGVDKIKELQARLDGHGDDGAADAPVAGADADAGASSGDADIVE